MKKFLSYSAMVCAFVAAFIAIGLVAGLIKLPPSVVTTGNAVEVAAAKAVQAEVPALQENIRTDGLKGNLALSSTIQQWTVDRQPVRVKILVTKDTGGAVLKTNAHDDPGSLLPPGVKYHLAPHPRLQGKELVGIPESEAAKFQ